VKKFAGLTEREVLAVASSPGVGILIGASQD
jgi:hypothetical protein